MSEGKFHIIVDSREASNGKASGGKKIYEGLLKYPDLEVTVQNLGDNVDYFLYGKNGQEVIQRKAATEMMRCKPVFEDCKGMKFVENAKSFLLVEGTLSVIQKFSKMREEPIIGILNTVLDEWDTKIIPSPNSYWTTKILYQRAKRLGRTKEKHDLPVGCKVRSDAPIEEKSRAVIESLPFVSTTLSKRILLKYGSALNALNNVDKWSSDIDGMGNKKITVIKQVLDYKFQLLEVNVNGQ